MATSDRRYTLTDERGSVIAAVDGATGAQTAANTYGPYGEPGAGNGGEFGYAGQLWIPEANLFYMRNRMYNYELGRFMQTDPIGYQGGMNLYGYVGNDPVNLVDPSGLGDKDDKGCRSITGSRICLPYNRVGVHASSGFYANISGVNGGGSDGAILFAGIGTAAAYHGSTKVTVCVGVGGPGPCGVRIISGSVFGDSTFGGLINVFGGNPFVEPIPGFTPPTPENIAKTVFCGAPAIGYEVSGSLSRFGAGPSETVGVSRDATGATYAYSTTAAGTNIGSPVGLSFFTTVNAPTNTGEQETGYQITAGFGPAISLNIPSDGGFPSVSLGISTPTLSFGPAITNTALISPATHQICNN